jgi:Rps23 Pro-64 3,4-dihydroxylase Tpa1-like proline 4-hydroxylase
MVIKPFDREKVRQQFNSAQPFRWFEISPFVDEGFIDEVVNAYPTFETAQKLGFEFKAINEQKKVQITDSAKFPGPVKRLSDALASAEWLKDLEYITGIPRLVADEKLDGGGMHLTGPGGRLDVHVDFNYLEGQKLHRRLNILVYLNPNWNETWGGNIELWDRDVKNRAHSFPPVLNRCVVFETNNISYHGVSPVSCPPEIARRSFAAYYYTREAPAGWQGEMHSTIFRARPSERLRGYVLMPLENVQKRVLNGVERVARRVKRILEQ